MPEVTLKIKKRTSTAERERHMHVLNTVVNAGLYHLQNELSNVALQPEITLQMMLAAQEYFEVHNLNQTVKRKGKLKKYLQMATRLLAAVYVCKEYDGGTCAKPNIVCKSNGKILMIVDEKSLK